MAAGVNETCRLEEDSRLYCTATALRCGLVSGSNSRVKVTVKFHSGHRGQRRGIACHVTESRLFIKNHFQETIGLAGTRVYIIAMPMPFINISVNASVNVNLSLLWVRSGSGRPFRVRGGPRRGRPRRSRRGSRASWHSGLRRLL